MRIEIMDNGETADAKMTLVIRDSELVVETNGDNCPIDVTTAEGLAVAVQSMQSAEVADRPLVFFVDPARLRTLRAAVADAYPPAAWWDWCSESAS